MNEPGSEERRSGSRLTDEEISKIAARASEIIQDNFTLSVGKVAIRISIYVLGAGFAALLAWLGIQGHLAHFIAEIFA